MAHEKPARRLGRGLDALFNTPGATAQRSQDEESALRRIEISQITSNPFQPRKSFKAAELQELQDSLKSSGLLQPVTVRPAPSGKGFELVAGERRLRAAANLGWKEIPAVVKEITDQEILTLALVENLQRTDLNPVEEAEGYEQLIHNFGYTQQSVAEMVGKDRSTVANVLRILQLPPAVRELLQDGKLTAGQARPLLALEAPLRITALARQVVEKGLSAREVEHRVRKRSGDSPAPRPGRPKKPDTRPPELRSLEQQLQRHLQTDVSIVLKGGTRGSVIVDFYSPEDLERVTEKLGLVPRPH